MSNEKNNFNTVNDSNCIITPGDAKIVEETHYFLNADKSKDILRSLELIFDGFLSSENSDDKTLRTDCLYHYTLTRDFISELIINQNKTAA